MALLDQELPPSDTIRWSPRRKAAVVEGVLQGVISLGEACQRYTLSAEEFMAWRAAVETHGIGALRVTRTQCYPKPPMPA
jgi:transposase-like protein